MKKSIAQLWVPTAFAVLATFQFAQAGTFTWGGASGANLYWKTPANGSPSGPPGANDFAQFFDAGATNIFGVDRPDKRIKEFQEKPRKPL